MTLPDDTHACDGPASRRLDVGGRFADAHRGGGMSAPATVVQLQGVRKHYGEVEALRGVDLTIGRGEVVAMLGPNGAGKTTAMSVMLGLRRATAGGVQLFGRDPRARRARSRCGVMLQESGVPGVLTARELVALFRSYYPRPWPTGRVLALAGLESVADRRVGQLSGGQRQRLYFALAVCGDPELLVLDEPTVGMDVEARQAFRQAVRELADAQRTIVLTTHDLEEADALARRVVVVDRGVVIADATPDEIKARIPSKRVRFRTASPPAGGAFEGLPCTALEQVGDRVRLLSAEPEVVLRELFRRGVVVADLEVAGADLEEAFLALTAHRGARA
jgi:ABC-2 type transport system ATP-binding protein